MCGNAAGASMTRPPSWRFTPSAHSGSRSSEASSANTSEPHRSQINQDPWPSSGIPQAAGTFFSATVRMDTRVRAAIGQEAWTPIRNRAGRVEDQPQKPECQAAERPPQRSFLLDLGTGSRDCTQHRTTAMSRSDTSAYRALGKSAGLGHDPRSAGNHRDLRVVGGTLNGTSAFGWWRTGPSTNPILPVQRHCPMQPRGPITIQANGRG